MTLRLVFRLALAAALPVAVWSQALPRPTGPSTWSGATTPGGSRGYGARIPAPPSPAPAVSARTPPLSPAGGGIMSEPAGGSQPSWSVTTIERVLLDAAITRARTRPLNSGSRRRGDNRRRQGSGGSCLVEGAEAFETESPVVGLQPIN